MADYFVPNLWPKRRLNLICGASGAGKTRWILPQLVSLHKSGTPVLYTTCDRTIEDAQETLEEMGHSKDSLPMVSFMNAGDDIKFSVDGLYVLTEGHNPEILFIETIAALVTDMNKVKDVLEFSRRINRYMRTTHISVWGSSWIPKAREGDQFTRTRDNVMGSAAWPGICGTIVYIDSPNGEEAPERDINILLRNAPSRIETMRFNDHGILEPFSKPTLDGLLASSSGKLTWDDLQAWREQVGCSESTLKRWKNDMLARHKLRFLAKGEYMIGSPHSLFEGLKGKH
jgi:hypothetical protein